MATACRKFGAEMEISAICQLLSNALKRGESFDLLVLKVSPSGEKERERERERELMMMTFVINASFIRSWWAL